MGEQISKRMIDQILMDLNVVGTPHMEPEKAQEFVDELLQRRRDIYGVEENTAPLDKEGLDALKAMLKDSSQAIAVK